MTDYIALQVILGIISTVPSLLCISGVQHMHYYYYAPTPRVGALNDDAHLTSVCLTSVCRVHRA